MMSELSTTAMRRSKSGRDLPSRDADRLPSLASSLGRFLLDLVAHGFAQRFVRKLPTSQLGLSF
ncbi:hypothetical protein C7E19_00690 [Stenotrophomonas maltophilia]|nr:hypothetical protein [Stenotrophomonas maltophilia]PJL53515.1 hypothetical protein B9Y74_03850 [Stenotrophomonas maltophilia]PSD19391.1 hypothetical protein C7E19_00690 [Stenotrophomonas maltophilia]